MPLPSDKTSYQRLLRRVRDAISTQSSGGWGPAFCLLADQLIVRLEELPTVPASLELEDGQIRSTSLYNLVCACFTMTCSIDIQSLQQRLSHCKEISPTIVSGLCNMISKIAFYKKCARCLCKLARKVPLVRSFRTEAVWLPSTHRQALELNCQATTIGVWRRAMQSSRLSEKRINKFLSRADTQGPSTFQGKSQYALSKGSKIHAEIQLLNHVERWPGAHQPRMVASSKNPCYMCGLFISLDKKYVSLGSHGRIYPGWRLPAIGSKGAYERFATALEGQIVSRAQLDATRTNRRLGGPTESTVSDPNISLTSVATVTAGGHERNQEPAIVQNDSNTDGDGDQSPCFPISTKMDIGSDQTDSEDQRSQSQPETLVIAEDEFSPPKSVTSDRSRDSSIAGSFSPRIETAYMRPSDELEIFVDYRTEAGDQEHTSPLTIRRFSQGQMDSVPGDRKVFDLDLELLPGKEEQCSLGEGGILLKFRRCLYVLTAV